MNTWNDRASEAIVRRVAAEEGKSPEEIEAMVARARALAEQVPRTGKAK